MRLIISKIPLLFWAVVLILIAFLLVINNSLTFKDSSQITLLSGLFALIGLLFVSIQIQAQWKNNKITTEFLNQPHFKIVGFSMSAIRGGKPRLCTGTEHNFNMCTDDHWFDIIQVGKLPAKNISVAIFHHKENEIDIKDRWQKIEMLYEGERQQYKLKPYSIPFTHFENHSNDHFHILIKYTSAYSKIRYRRDYRLFYSPTDKTNEKVKNDWRENISYYDVSLKDFRDSNSISINEIILGRWNILLRLIKLKKADSNEDWLIEI